MERSLGQQVTGTGRVKQSRITKWQDMQTIIRTYGDKVNTEDYHTRV